MKTNNDIPPIDDGEWYEQHPDRFYRIRHATTEEVIFNGFLPGMPVAVRRVELDNNRVQIRAHTIDE